MLFEIKNRFDGSVIFSLECGALKECSHGIHFFMTREEAEDY